MKEFTLPISPQGTSFQQKVWKTLEEIPYGSTATYKDIAIKLNSPTSCRAVANAISKNPILLIVPCHRVIGRDGSLTGFRAGLDRKKALLELEKEH